ncbi:SICA antigen [Plasmodium coatneyi]|uniref:SICA antigen n=1 Tax=Plasmodium coatneyi TaxID=208452 RepID=A0A1B1DTZ6_9APIC|nr:SICA antigen [Plasmodium coatneyi]ANQ06250.1 SICA antigen [Plasmodium coatneyi]
MDPPKKFEDLVDEWYNSKGKSKETDAGELFRELQGYVDEFMKGIGGKNDSGIGEVGCADITVKKKGIEGRAKTWCVFLLQNLWKIEELTKTEGDTEIWNKKMKKYVRCEIMKVWLYIYQDMYCEAADVMTHAFSKIKYFCEQMSTGEECDACEYGTLDPMRVNDKSVLEHILDKIQKGERIIRMVNNLPWGGKCERKPGSEGGQDRSAVGRVNDNARVKEILSQIKDEIRTKSTGSSPDQQSKQKLMTKEQFQFLSQLLPRWIKEHGMANVGQFKIGIWAGLGQMFNNLMKTLGPGEEPEIAPLCATGKKESGEEIKPWEDKDKGLCKGMLKVMLYTNGLTQKLAIRDKVAGEDEVTTYLRCLVGNIILIALYGKHCRFDRVLPHVSKVVEDKVKVQGMKMTDKECYNVDLEKTALGGKLIGKTIGEWVNEWDKSKIRNYEGIMKNNDCSTEEGKNGSEQRSEQKEADNSVGGKGNESIKELKKIMKEGKTVSHEGADEILKKIEKGEIKDGDDLGSKVDDKIVQEKMKAASRADEDCKEKKALCDRVKCVTTNWFKDRITPGKQPQNWCTFWNNDIEGELLNNLSAAMTNAETGEGGICKDIGQDKDGTAHKEANRKTCEYIVKGLKRIYEIQAYGTWEGNDAAKKKKNNQIFGQTMSCALLNIYVDELVKRSKDACPIDENIIIEAFQKGNEQMNILCKGGKDNCVECTRDTSYAKCTLDVEEKLFNKNKSEECEIGKDNNGAKIGDKVEGLLKKDIKVKRTLNSICRDCTKGCKTLCDRLECIAHNWFEDRIDNSGNKRDWCTFWNTDARNRLKELSKEMVEKHTTMGTLCEGADEKNTITTDTKRKACNYITAGLKYIYEVKENTGKENKKIARNYRLTDQTMYCLFLNAYADMLIQKTKGQVCLITEKEIQKMFAKGNGQMDKWCAEKQNGKGGDCVKCERDPNYKNCTLSVDSNLWTNKKKNNETCAKDGNNMKGEVEELLNPTKNKDQEVTQAVNAINTINKNNTLCDRVKCIYYRWGENRKNPDINKGKPRWPQFWNPDVETRLKNLSGAISKKNGTYESLCENIQDGKSGPDSEASKKACKFIVLGLEHIYQIPKGTDSKDPQKVLDDQMFHRTFSCMLLNIFADEMGEKCSAMQQDILKGIQHAFGKSEHIKKNTSPCNEEGDLCPLCERDQSYTSCKIQDTDGDPIGKRMKEMLNGDSGITQTLSTITTACQPKPAAAKPAPEKSAASGDQQSSQSSSPTENLGRSESSGDAAPASAPAKQPERVPAKPESAATTTSNGTPESTARGKNCDPASGANSLEDAASCLDVLDAEFQKNNSSVSNKDDKKYDQGIFITPGEYQATPVEPQPRGSQTDADSHGHLVVTGNSLNNTNKVTCKPESNHQSNGHYYELSDAFGGGSPSSTETAPAEKIPAKGAKVDDDRTQVHGGARSQDTAGTQSPSVRVGGGGRNSVLRAPKTLKVVSVKKEGMVNPSDLLIPYLPTIPVLIGTSIISYLLWKYFFLGKRRKRYRRAHQVRGPPALEEQLLDDVDDQDDGPHEYTLVKERKQLRSVPTGRTKSPKKQGVGRPAGHRVGRRTIIDIHLEILNECQKGGLHSMKEDFFEILVQEFMGSEFIKEEKVPKDSVPKEVVLKEQVPSSVL